MTLQNICLIAIGKHPNNNVNLLHQELRDLIPEVKITEKIVVRKVDKPRRTDTSEYKTIQTITTKIIYKTGVYQIETIHIDNVIAEISWISDNFRELLRFKDGKLIQVLYTHKDEIKCYLCYPNGRILAINYKHRSRKWKELKSGYYVYKLFKGNFSYSGFILPL